MAPCTQQNTIPSLSDTTLKLLHMIDAQLEALSDVDSTLAVRHWNLEVLANVTVQVSSLCVVCMVLEIQLFSRLHADLVTEN